MEDEKYNLIFKAELVKSVDLDTAKANLGRLFKISGAKLDALFSGKPITLKKNLDFDAATKYRVAIKKAGARVDLVPVLVSKPTPEPSLKPETTTDAVKPAATASGKAVFGERVSVLSATPSESPSPASVSTPEPAADTNEHGLGLAPVGTPVLKDGERREVSPIDVDISSMSLRQGGGDILDADEKPRVASPAVESPDYGISPPGEDLLADAEKRTMPELSLDLSDLSIAEPGVQLLPEKPAETVQPPDTSKLKLVDV